MTQLDASKRTVGRVFTIALLSALGSAALAEEYYVSPSGDDWNDGTSASSPWRTIGKANSTLRAGDTVYLRGGEYVDDPIEPSRSGEAGNPITYTSYQGEEPVITSHKVLGLGAAIELRDVSHIVIERIKVSGRARSPEATIESFAVLSSASYTEIRDSEFEYAEGWAGINIVGSSHHNKLLRNRIDFVGAYNVDGNDFGDSIWVGNSAHHNLIASNYLTHGAHNLMTLRGYENLIQDNIFDNDWSDVLGSGLGGRNLSIAGERNVFQRNIVRNAAESTDAPKNSGMKVEGIANIVRRNVLMDNHHDAIQTETGSWQAHASDNRIYHNTIYNNGGAAWRVRFYETDNYPTGNVFKNNLVVGNRQDVSGNDDVDFRIILNRSPVDAPGGNHIVNNVVVKGSSSDARIYMTPPWAVVDLSDAESEYGAEIRDNIQEEPSFAVNQKFVIDDFELMPGSPGHDDGAPLSTTASSGFGTRVSVRDASYFNDGHSMSPGDVIRVGAERDLVVLDVNYGRNEITVDREIGWSSGDAVSLEFEGAAPDIGAVEAGQATQMALKPKAPRLMARPVHN